MNTLTRRQREIFNFLRDNADRFAHPAEPGRALRGVGHGLARVVSRAVNGAVCA